MPLIPTQQPPYYTTDDLAPSSLTITNAQFLTLPTTPVIIIPGIANKVLAPYYITYKLNITTPYGNVTDETLTVTFETAIGTLFVLNLNGIDDTDSLTGFATLEQSLNLTFAELAGLDIILTSNNTGNYTGGSTSNSLELKILYTTIN